jgi:hypothetical protein
MNRRTALAISTMVLAFVLSSPKSAHSVGGHHFDSGIQLHAITANQIKPPGAKFQNQGFREALGYPALGEPPRAYVAPPAYGYVPVPDRPPVYHPKITHHRRNY